VNTLSSRFPSARRLQWLANASAGPEARSPDDLARFIEPYLHWVLLEMDSSSTDILIGEPETSQEDDRHRELLILGGEVAQTWLRNVRKAPS